MGTTAGSTFHMVRNECTCFSEQFYIILLFFSYDSTCADPECFVRGGPTLTGFFIVDKGREDPNTTISGPS